MVAISLSNDVQFFLKNVLNMSIAGVTCFPLLWNRFICCCLIQIHSLVLHVILLDLSGLSRTIIDPFIDVKLWTILGIVGHVDSLHFRYLMRLNFL